MKVEEDLIHLAFEVDDMDEAIKDLNSKNVAITDGPTTGTSGGRFLFIDAPDGYEIELIERPSGVSIV